jgi:hypothetical protein
MESLEEVAVEVRRMMVPGFDVQFRHGPKDGILCEIAIIDTELVVEGYDELDAWMAFLNAVEQLDWREA